MNLVLLGDLMLGRGVGEEVPRHPPEWFWGDVLPLLREADLAVANLECALTMHREEWRPEEKAFHFRGPPEAVEVLHAGNVRVVSLANNHAMDYQVTGLRDTLRHLGAEGIATAGAGEDLAEALEPAIVTIRGIRVGMAAFTDNEPDWAAGACRPGVAWLDTDDVAAARAALEGGILRARAGGAEFVIASLHWGPNMVLRPPRRFRRLARAAIESGAGVLHGHSAHVPQGIGVHRGCPLLFDTGDFLDDYAMDPDLRNDRSFLYRLAVEGGAVRRLELVPVQLEYARVRIARPGEAEPLLARTEALSRELGTVLRREGERLVWEGSR
jgi:poly-gamma-glutamate synthesis protein (capsule biosynthesis protein)